RIVRLSRHRVWDEVSGRCACHGPAGDQRRTVGWRRAGARADRFGAIRWTLEGAVEVRRRSLAPRPCFVLAGEPGLLAERCEGVGARPSSTEPGSDDLKKAQRLAASRASSDAASTCETG